MVAARIHVNAFLCHIMSYEWAMNTLKTVLQMYIVIINYCIFYWLKWNGNYILDYLHLDYPNILDYLNREPMASVGDLNYFTYPNPQGVWVPVLYTLSCSHSMNRCLYGLAYFTQVAYLCYILYNLLVFARYSFKEVIWFFLRCASTQISFCVF